MLYQDKTRQTNYSFLNPGFTLIELLVVIAILAILSVVAFAVFSNVSKGARDARKKGDINAIANAYEVSFSNGAYNELTDSQFASGKIPQPPEGGNYPGLITGSPQTGFQVCAALGDNPGPCSSPSATCYCKQSSQGIYVPTPSPSSSPSPSPSPSPGPIYVAFTKPISINATALSNNLTNLTGPLIATGIAFSADYLDSNFSSQLSVLQSIKNANDPKVTDYLMMFGSYTTVQNLTPAQVNSLINAGVTTLGYNPESIHSPSAEFAARFNTDNTNSVAIFAQAAKAKGFKASWAPLRPDADSTPVAALQIIYNGIDGNDGMDNLSLQEQIKIAKACTPSRVSADQTTFNNHKNIKNDLSIGVQIMSSWCDSPTSTNPPITCDPVSNPCGDDYANANCTAVQPTGQYQFEHCDYFTDQVDQLYSGAGINNLAIWVYGAPDTTYLVNFVQALRRAN